MARMREDEIRKRSVVARHYRSGRITLQLCEAVKPWSRKKRRKTKQEWVGGSSLETVYENGPPGASCCGGKFFARKLERTFVYHFKSKQQSKKKLHEHGYMEKCLEENLRKVREIERSPFAGSNFVRA
uniref:Uncharacterized protein n=1 Tax=Vespula pensylvanica TaxID=30213 RepID=A0A834PGP4_VESPE|nr:hypothetical protein H0235_001823 [Vespula pensylvanica]